MQPADHSRKLSKNIRGTWYSVAEVRAAEPHVSYNSAEAQRLLHHLAKTKHSTPGKTPTHCHAAMEDATAALEIISAFLDAKMGALLRSNGVLFAASPLFEIRKYDTASYARSFAPDCCARSLLLATSPLSV